MKNPPYLSSNIVTKSLTLLLMLLLFSNARADIGAVWVTAVSDTTMTVSWSSPTGNYQLSGSTPNYQVCYKLDGTFGTVCGSGLIETTNNNFITLTGLTPNTTYKIRVKCHCEYNNIWGNWVNPKWRKINTIKASTTPPVVIIPPSYLLLTGATDLTMDVEMFHFNIPDFNEVRVCYKRKWTLVSSFETKCFDNPVGFWGASDNTVGWFDINFLTSPLTATIHPDGIILDSCTAYKVVAFGFHPSGVEQIGDSAVANTSGFCGFHNVMIGILDDHTDDVLIPYINAVEHFYQKPLIDHLAATHDHTLYRLREEFKFADMGDLRYSVTLMEYLLEENHKLYNRWQQEPALKKAGLTLDRFLERKFPELKKQLTEELQGRRWQTRFPTDKAAAFPRGRP